MGQQVALWATAEVSGVEVGVEARVEVGMEESRL